MGLTKWDPFKDLLFLQERMSRIFDEAVTRFNAGAGLSSSAWCPPVDIYETENDIILKAELPGVGINNVSVEVDGNVITLKGERRFDKNLSEENYHRMERFYGTFQRVFSLPNTVNKAGIKANFKDGVLEITVPKTEVKTSEGIKIKVE